MFGINSNAINCGDTSSAHNGPQSVVAIVAAAEYSTQKDQNSERGGVNLSVVVAFKCNWGGRVDDSCVLSITRKRRKEKPHIVGSQSNSNSNHKEIGN